MTAGLWCLNRLTPKLYTQLAALGARLAAGLADAIAIAKGEADPAAYRVHVPADIDVVRIRRNMGLTREAFAMRFGLRLGTVRDWEQRKRRPEGAARVLLTVIEKEPEAVTRALVAAAA